MTRHLILGVHITDRLRNAGAVQALFTEFGCHIRTRLGLHDVTGQPCAPNGLILLELVGDAARCEALAARLRTVEGVEVQQMVFEHQ